MLQEELPSAEEVSQALADILGGSDFEAFEGGLMRRVLTDLWRRFRDWISGIFPEISETQGELLTMIIVALALGAVAVAVVRSLPEGDPRSARRDPGAVPDERRTARDWLRIAGQQARAAAYRQAATALYQGFVLTLERRGAVEYHPSKTPGEYALEAAGAPGLDEPEKAGSADFIRSFQELAFGQDTPTLSGYDGLERLAGRAGCEATRDAGR